MKKTSKSTDPDRLPAGKLLAWAGAGVSGGASFIVLGYVSLYATDTLGLAPALIGVLVLVSAFANVAGALLAAYVIDRSPETRWGKARPYELAVLGIWAATWALFSTPTALDESGRIVWLFVTYITINAVFDPILRGNDTLYMARAFANRRVYAKVYTRAGIFTTLGGIVLSITLPIALGWAGKSPELWSVVMACFSIPLAAIGMTRFFFVKEQFNTSTPGIPPVRLKDIFVALGTTKWVWFLCALAAFSSAVNGANMVSYYFRYIVGNLALQGAIAAAGILVLPLTLIFPRLMKRFAISQILVGGAALGVIGAVFYAVANGNLVIFTIGALLSGCALLPLSYLVGVMVLDICSFNEWRGKHRLESTLGAVVGVFGRLGIGVAGFIVGVVLSAAGYDGALDVQEPAAEAAIVALTAGVPAVCFTMVVVLMLVYGRFDRRILPQVHAELDARHAERDAAEEMPVIANVPGPGAVSEPTDYAEVALLDQRPSEQTDRGR